MTHTFQTAALGSREATRQFARAIARFWNDDIARPLLVVLLIVGAWIGAALVNPGVLSPSEVLIALAEVARNDLSTALAATLSRFVCGFALGAVIGIPIGLAMGSGATAHRVLGSIVHPLRQVPLFGWIPLIGLVFGLGESSRIAFVTLAVSYVLVLAALEAARAVPPSLREVARLHRLGRLAEWRYLRLPAMVPPLLSGVRVAVVVAWSAVFGAEILLTGGPGLGTMVWGARELGRYDIVGAGTLVVIVIGVLTSLALGELERRVLRWRDAR
jgi:sulfonate transport system permease protein